MPRTPRCLFPPSRFHLGSKGTGGAFVFLDDVDRDAFVVLLHRAAKMFGVELLAYTVLGTHFHVIVEVTSPAQLGRMMHRVLGLYAQRFNRRHGRKGHLFEERFWSWVVRDEEHFDAAVGYVLNNAVAAGLVRDWRDWRWTWSRYAAKPGTVPWPPPKGTRLVGSSARQ